MKKVTLLNSKIKVLIGVLVVGVVLITGWLILESQKSSAVFTTEISREKALELANQLLQSKCSTTFTEITRKDYDLESILDRDLSYTEATYLNNLIEHMCPMLRTYLQNYTDIWVAKKNLTIGKAIVLVGLHGEFVCGFEAFGTNLEELCGRREVIIATDKTEYEKDEEIKLTLINDFDKSIYYRDWTKSWNECKGSSFRLGKKIKENEFDFFGIGLAECLKPIVSLKPHSKITYSLDPKELEEIPSRRLEKGTYKWEFTFGFEKDLRITQKVYSNEFTIKEEAELPSDWKTYRNEEYGFEFRYSEEELLYPPLKTYEKQFQVNDTIYPGIQFSEFRNGCILVIVKTSRDPTLNRFNESDVPIKERQYVVSKKLDSGKAFYHLGMLVTSHAVNPEECESTLNQILSTFRFLE